MGNYIYRNQLVTGSRYIQTFYRPQTKLREGYVFTGVCDSVHSGGMRGCWGGGWLRRAWLLLGGHAWLLLRGCAWLLLGACMVAPGGMHGCSLGGACMVAPGGRVWLLPGGAMHGCSWGACMVAPGGHAWLLLGGMRGCSGGGVRGIQRDTEIRSMSGRYASYWNAFLLKH